MRPGDSSKPIIYQVENIRDGRSFSVRRTVALQGGKTLFFMSASFHVGENGLEHADPAPEVPGPDQVAPISEQLRADPDRLSMWARIPRPIDVRYLGGSGYARSGERPAEDRQRVWMKADGKLPDDPLMHVCVLTYASDLTLLDTVLNRHGAVWGGGGYLGTSLDHAMWFHRPFRADEWVLYDAESPTASGGRGLAQGRFFDGEGRHLATAAQEGLLRRTPSLPECRRRFTPLLVPLLSLDVHITRWESVDPKGRKVLWSQTVPEDDPSLPGNVRPAVPAGTTSTGEQFGDSNLMPLTEAARSTGRREGAAPGGPRPGHWRPDIEGLRALAVVMVIAAHIHFFYSEGGFVGVDVFFVISGFLITSLLLREIERTGRVSLTKFYARRAVRLLPAAATVLLATLVAAWLWLPRTRLGDIAADTAAAALNVVNFRLASEGTDYLNADADPRRSSTSGRSRSRSSSTSCGR
ncbi:hypothetical protein GCM10029992_53070 [Glycomyces albus]